MTHDTNTRATDRFLKSILPTTRTTNARLLNRLGSATKALVLVVDDVEADLDYEGMTENESTRFLGELAMASLKSLGFLEAFVDLPEELMVKLNELATRGSPSPEEIVALATACPSLGAKLELGDDLGIREDGGHVSDEALVAEMRRRYEPDSEDGTLGDMPFVEYIEKLVYTL